MKQGKTLAALGTELQRQRSMRKDFVNVIKIGLGFPQPFENRGIKNMHNTSRKEKMALQTGGTCPPKKNI